MTTAFQIISISSFHLTLYSLNTDKVVPVLNKLSTTPWRRTGEWMYRSTFSWPRHQMEVSGQLHVPAALPPGKEPLVPTGQEVGWTPEPVWMIWRRGNSWPYQDLNSDPSVVQPIASHYTNYATPAPVWILTASLSNQPKRSSPTMNLNFLSYRKLNGATAYYHAIICK
jgi:hypothetical protein